MRTRLDSMGRALVAAALCVATAPLSSFAEARSATLWATDYFCPALSVITDTDADFGLRVSYNLCYTFSARRIVNFLRGERRETSVSPGCRPAAGERGLFRVPATRL